MNGVKNENKEHVFSNKNQTTTEDSYFGGRITFKTKIVWPNVIFFTLLHIGAFYGLWLCLNQMWHLQFLSTLFAWGYAVFGGQGITMGAHRLWCHRSFKARRPLRIILIFAQTIAGQNCCHTWVKEHRQHHKYSDTSADPYDSTRGLFFSHMGWLMMRKQPECKAKAKVIYIEDIERDPVIMFQKRHFKKLFFLIGMAIPVAIPCLMWGETFWNSVSISFFCRYLYGLHSTWAVNSFAHYYGNKPYDKAIVPAENAIVSVFAFGEGWHNYHHAFPWDYKASEYGMKLNFTRDAIQFFERIGWAYDLKEASSEMVKSKIRRTGDGTHHWSYADVVKNNMLNTKEDETSF